MCGGLYALRGTIAEINFLFAGDPRLGELIQEAKEAYDQGQLGPFREHIRRILCATPYMRPMDQVPVIANDGNGSVRFTSMRWGTKLEGSHSMVFNTRSETVATKPMWKRAWHNCQRCVVVAGGFYEWPQKDKPYYFGDNDGNPLLFAGIWISDSSGEWCSILTKKPHRWFEFYHNREPLFVQYDNLQRWIHDTTPPKDLQQDQWPDFYEHWPCNKPTPGKFPERASQKDLFWET